MELESVKYYVILNFQVWKKVYTSRSFTCEQKKKVAIGELMLKAKSLEMLNEIQENDRGFKPVTDGFKNLKQDFVFAFFKYSEKSFLRSCNS